MSEDFAAPVLGEDGTSVIGEFGQHAHDAGGRIPSDSQSRPAFIGIDIGGTKIEGVVIDESGRLITSMRHESDHGDTAVTEQIVTMIATLHAHIAALGLTLAGIGIGIPGTIDSETGEVSNAVNLGIAGFNLQSRIAQSIPGVPIRIENDVNAAALGAWTVVHMHDGGKGLQMAFLNFGTGLACGIVDDGHVYHGATGVAGEIGHIPIEAHGYLCKCGQRGCLETVASGSGVARLWPTNGGYALPELMDAARRGDMTAQEKLSTVIQGMTTAIMIIALSIDPQKIVIGGGLAKTGQPLIDAIKADLRERARASSFIESLKLPQRLMRAPMNTPIGAIGAAAVAIKRDKISNMSVNSSTQKG
ncbi:ROK family protein [Bifidobacterium aquikefiricola]|uniref:ROK family protein n=1 Tax=Bifidobacterium aquikefiricola TaxID=3059038 RepID=A0AB39U867_9BIFI